MNTIIILNNAEIQSCFNRVDWAEGLILQLPETHEGRNSWLINFGKSKEAVEFRNRSNLYFDEETQSNIYQV